MKILLFANTDWYLYNFRLGLAQDLRVSGNQVILLSPPGEFQERIREAGFHWISFPLSRQGTNPLFELWTLFRLWRVYAQVQPDLVHHFTIKPVIYGSLAAKLLRIPAIVNSITGLGHLFIDERGSVRLLRWVAKLLYRFSLRGTQVVFEHEEDRQTFLKNNLVAPEQAHLIMGTGVDVETFQPHPTHNPVPVVLFAGRMLTTKGLPEFIEAARLLTQQDVQARLAVAGNADPGNPASIPANQIEKWKQVDYVEWWGWQPDMATTLASVDIFCLPSHREGVSNALTEACAAGLPIVTTDVPGCRSVVTNNKNGFLVPVNDPPALAEALRKLISDSDLRVQMGKAGRQIAVERFSQERVLAEQIAIYQKLQPSLYTNASNSAHPPLK